MASIIPGYEYDIFISYRQKDNKHDGWVTEFVNNLKGELESTFKEEISVYFDINPHDGLLETHDVDSSLKEKLKCLIFIPVVSRTYCDSRSFAWEHEFKPFVEMSSIDQFGSKVKLPNGNVATRILPIQIHDLNPDDRAFFESELGGFLRAIEFIYIEPGVNRPLKPDDDDKVNLNRTKYRNQINKTANAIDEIISSLKRNPATTHSEKLQHEEQPAKILDMGKTEMQTKHEGLTMQRLLTGIILLTIIIITAILAFPKISGKDKYKDIIDADGRISVAVMPFRNMTGDSLYNKWQDSFQSLIISHLSNTDKLKVYSFEIMLDIIGSTGYANYASITPAIARDIALKLESGMIVTGSLSKAGENLRINLQLTKTESSEIFKAFTLDFKGENEFFTVADSLSAVLNNFLRIEILKKELGTFSNDLPINTSSPEAFTYFIEADKMFWGNDSRAREYFLKALEKDTGFIDCYFYLSCIYNSLGDHKKAETNFQRVEKGRDKFSLQYQLFLDHWKYGYLEKNPQKGIQIVNQLSEENPNNRIFLNQIGDLSRLMKNYDKEIEAYEKYIALDKKWGVTGKWYWPYVELGDAYHIKGDHKREEQLFKQALQIRPGSPAIISRQAKCALFLGDTTEARGFITKYLSTQSFNEAQLKNYLGSLYSSAGIIDKAELYFRQALILNPNNHWFKNNLALLLIKNDINIEEGIKLADQALERSQDNFNYQYTKGLGLFKQGKYAEALVPLEKSWSARPYYEQDLYMIIQEARKVVANQK
jgi:tetratricopeptide (TPR) repeat protein